MKKFAKAVTAFLLSAFLPCLNAQITLEHTYTGDLLRRIELENSGEKYYVFDRAAAELRFYNADHSPWKTVALIKSPGQRIESINYVGETRIDPDPGLEIAYTCAPEPGEVALFESVVIQENGTVLFSRASSGPLSASVHENENLPARFIIKAATGAFPDSFHVYTLSGLQWQHSYYGKNMKRVYLENSGEKYYLLNQSDSYITLFNADHTLWKEIPLPHTPGLSVERIEHVSETKFNTDALLEIGYHSKSPTVSESRIVNEQGTVLFSLNETLGNELSLISGLDAKLIVRLLPLGHTRIYSVPGLQVEHEYTYTASALKRIRLEGSGEKYQVVAFQNSYIRLFNADHTPWKQIGIQIPAEYTSAGFIHLSETRLDPDNRIEQMYIMVAYPPLAPKSQGWISNEDYESLLVIPGAQQMSISEIPGLSNKLLATVDTSTDNLHVYSLPSSTYLGMSPEAALPDAVSVYPNPASGSFVLESDKILKNVYISSMNGAVVQQINVYTNKTTVDISGLRSGLYIVSGNRQDGTPFRKKIVVQ
ncbi:MAG: T9SS type A sorting domain-containing protein [Flavobacteriales bacterium]